MRQLVTGNLEAYEAMALGLAREPDLLTNLRERLRSHRDSSNLFDTSGHTRALEAALIAAFDDARSGARR